MNAFAEEYLPAEVLENKLIDYNFSAQVSHNSTEHTYRDTQLGGLQCIQPVAAQILSVTDSNGRPLHIELDSATTVSYVT